MACDFKVLEVLNKKKDRRRRHGEGKDDEIDAERAARDVLAADGTSIPKLRGRLDELRSCQWQSRSCQSGQRNAPDEGGNSFPYHSTYKSKLPARGRGSA
jgi:hypothetical protein